jgi:hypothetical protein
MVMDLSQLEFTVVSPEDAAELDNRAYLGAEAFRTDVE